jgi:cell division transport system ATP-binding protein
MTVFQKFNTHGTTVIFATHNQELIASVPEAKILVLENGSVTHASWHTDAQPGPDDRRPSR